MRRKLATGFAALAVLVASGAAAHTAWLVREGSGNSWLLRFGGHGGELEQPQPEKLEWVRAYDTDGKRIRLERRVRGDEVRVVTASEPAVIALHYDNGIHSRTATPGPSVEKPMNEVRGAVSAVSAVKYGKTIVQWAPVVTRRTGQQFEVVPLSAEQPVAGQPIRVRVLQDGGPVAGVSVGHGEDTSDAKTDANGVASFTPRAGFNKLWAGRRIAQSGNPRFTELSYEYLLGFDAR